MQAINLIVSLNPEVIGITGLSLQVSATAMLLSALVGIPAGVLIALNEFPFKSAASWLSTRSWACRRWSWACSSF